MTPQGPQGKDQTAREITERLEAVWLVVGPVPVDPLMAAAQLQLLTDEAW
jgi:hypothetical protein